MRLTDTQNWTTELKMKRQVFGISQNKLATASGITRPYLSDIENGKTVPTEQVKLAILDALERFNPDNPLDMLFDYVRIRFPTDNIHHVVEEILHLNLDYMIHEDFGYYSYPEHYRFGDIMVLASVDLAKGILLELKGKGCRQYENFLLAQHRSWYDFFTDCFNANGIFKRLDLAINDKTGILNIPELARKCKQEECISVFRSFKNYRSGELVHRDEKPDMGNTLYIGSLKSEVYFCIYEKDYEQFVKNDVPLADAEVKNRFEIRLKNDRATHAIKDLLTYQNAEKTAFEIINRYIRFVDKDDTKRRSDWQTNEQWKIFIGKNRGELRLTTKPEPYTFERTLNWLRHQVAPTLKVTSILDVLNETDILQAMIREAKLTEKHEKLIEQQHLDVEDVIL
ncbi:TPA_asm: helix-turn-helix domain-containing protein [Listeria monocytogenes]|uniref:MobT family relaxase n=2 Tax=Bacillota TaxID=1239 RepID=UPI000E738E77|nr:MobT family relaxase [Enterococcus casseliflavus]EAC7426788.1 XRE family transcriptional regulator [Listeria monocytogenes]EAC7427199.1 XRE family transcriptional regulator [Listeria monocytogenes]EAD1751315.1 XRE family transcriptional regulator [Listeria monocytogenes]EAD1751421.1 XRE family transcriptional regulator [Listeria monocytogenes]EAD1820355.1 XRE family transcriptional regulator [Listeria monocytogenes]